MYFTLIHVVRRALLYATILLFVATALHGVTPFAAAPWSDQSVWGAQVNAVPSSRQEAPKAATYRDLRDEKLALIPNVGSLSYYDRADNYTARAIEGLAIGFNVTPLIGMDSSRLTAAYAGVATGVFYSHLGTGTSNFFGTNPDSVSTAPGANLLLIPANFKVGFYPVPRIRLSARGGGNVIYRSVANTIDLGRANSDKTGSAWRVFPNAGADAEFGLTRRVALILRPDFTFSPGNTLFMGTVGVTIPLI